MPEKTKTETEETKEFNGAQFDSIMEKYRSARSEEARAKIISDNAEDCARGIRLARKFEREAMPLYYQATSRLEESPVYDKVVLARDLVLTSLAGVAVYKTAKFVWAWFKGPV